MPMYEWLTDDLEKAEWRAEALAEAVEAAWFASIRDLPDSNEEV